MKRLIFMMMALLMLTAPALAESYDQAASIASKLLPEYMFFDGVCLDNTAVFLVEDAEGATYLAGCVREGDGWGITLSTAFPEWMGVGLDTYHAGDGSMRLWIYLPEEYRAYEDSEGLDAYVDLLPDGTWRVWGVNTGWEVIDFRRQSIYDDMGYEFFGDMTLSLDITQVDWAMLPRSFHQAMALLDTSRWMLVATDYVPVYAACSEDSAIISLGAAGAPVRVLSTADGMVQVQFIGRSDTGWMLEGDLLPGSEQIARYDAWCEDGFLYGVRDIILDSTDPVVSWYDVPHDESTAALFLVEHVEYVTVQGWCTEGCCYLLYSETLGTSGFVPIEQMPYPIE